MRNYLKLSLGILHGFLLAFMLLLFYSCQTKSNKDSNLSSDDLVKAAEELDSLFIEAFNSGDAEAMMNLYWNSPDLRAYFPMDMQLEGYEAVKASYLRDFQSGAGAKLEYIEANNLPFENGVVGHGIFRITMPVEVGDPMIFEGRFTEVKAMKDGKMVVVVDHASMPMPVPAEEAAVSEQ